MQPGMPGEYGRAGLAGGNPSGSRNSGVTIFARPLLCSGDVENARETMSRGSVAFCHGLHAGPWGSKIQALARVARECGFDVASADCRGLDDPRDRVDRLVEVARPLAGPLALVGSSLGAWTVLAASARLDAALLFLMAPALHLAGLPDPEPEPAAGRIVVVHGWRDEVVPVENVLPFARRHRAETHVFDADHRLLDALPGIERLLAGSLESLAG